MEENILEPRFLDIKLVWNQDMISDIVRILNYYITLPLDKEKIYMVIKDKKANFSYHKRYVS